VNLILALLLMALIITPYELYKKVYKDFLILFLGLFFWLKKMLKVR